MSIRRNSYFLENDSATGVLPELDSPNSFSYSVIPGHDTHFDDTIPTEALGGDQPGVIPDLKAESGLPVPMKEAMNSILRDISYGPEPTDELPTPMREAYNSLIGYISDPMGVESITESVNRLNKALSPKQIKQLNEFFSYDGILFESELKNKIGNIENKKQLDEYLNMIADKPYPDDLLKIFSWAGFIIGAIGGGAFAVTSFFGSLAGAASFSGVWATLQTCFNGLVGAFGTMFFGGATGTLLEYLVIKTANLILNKDYATIMEKVRAYNQLLKIINTNIDLCKKSKNEKKLKMFEEMRTKVSDALTYHKKTGLTLRA